MSEFFVGYAKEMPAGIRSRVRWFVAVALFLGLAAALLFSSSQRNFADSSFDFGHTTEMQGTLHSSPYPWLAPAAGAEASPAAPLLLVAPGKFGADPLVRDFAGRSVKLKGTLIHRGNDRMLELVPGSIEALPSPAPQPTPPRALGPRSLVGEIVDAKCYLGVMNPGEGKVHRECAARCLSGGIPPALATRDFDGQPKILLLTNSDGAPLPKSAFLSKVGQPVRISGQVLENNGLLTFSTSAERIEPLP